MDNITANSERDVLTFQPPRDISSGELSLHNQNGLLKYQYRKLEHARNIRLLGYSGRSESNNVRFHLSENSLKMVEGNSLPYHTVGAARYKQSPCQFRLVHISRLPKQSILS
jgi:hypothetical protein